MFALLGWQPPSGAHSCGFASISFHGARPHLDRGSLPLLYDYPVSETDRYTGVYALTSQLDNLWTQTTFEQYAHELRYVA